MYYLFVAKYIKCFIIGNEKINNSFIVLTRPFTISKLLTSNLKTILKIPTSNNKNFGWDFMLGFV